MKDAKQELIAYAKSIVAGERLARLHFGNGSITIKDGYLDENESGLFVGTLPNGEGVKVDTNTIVAVIDMGSFFPDLG